MALRRLPWSDPPYDVRMIRSEILKQLVGSWQAVAAIGAILALLVSLWTRGVAVVQIPAKVDSLSAMVKQHIDTSAKYGRVQARYQHRMLCVLVAATQKEKEHCVLDDVGDP